MKSFFSLYHGKERGFRVQVDGFRVVVQRKIYIIETQNTSPLKEEADRRPGIDCLEETEFCRKVVCALGIARTQIAADEMLTTT